MKRYRVLGWDFDARANMLNHPTESWTEDAKKRHQINIANTENEIINEFGNKNKEGKIKRFKLIGAKPFSIIAHHNELLDEIRNAYIAGNYYPALVGACALGERILNHLVLDLRDQYRGRIKALKQKRPFWRNEFVLNILAIGGIDLKETDIFVGKNFKNWSHMIDNLLEWTVINNEVAGLFKELSKKRHKSIHFFESAGINMEQECLETINILQKIIQKQFPAFGGDYFLSIPGEAYLKKELEVKPFFIKYYLPNSKLVSPYNEITQLMPCVVIKDKDDIEETNINDDEFVKLRIKAVSDKLNKVNSPSER